MRKGRGAFRPAGGNGREREGRLEAIRDLLRREKIHSQGDLEARLKGRGFRVTQATLSRDLRRLGVARHPDLSGGSVYGLPDDRRLGEHAVHSALTAFVGMAFSGNLGVVKTLPGYAASVAAAFDGAGVEGLLGTLAGDDTILVVASEGTSRTALKRAIVKRLPELEGRIE